MDCDYTLVGGETHIAKGILEMMTVLLEWLTAL